MLTGRLTGECASIAIVRAHMLQQSALAGMSTMAGCLVAHRDALLCPRCARRLSRVVAFVIDVPNRPIVYLCRFEELRREGFVGDVVTYNTVLKACMRARNGPRAERAHRAMLDAGIRGDEVTYNTLVKALAYAAEDARPATAAAVTPLLTAPGAQAASFSAWDLQKVRSSCIDSGVFSKLAATHPDPVVSSRIGCAVRLGSCAAVRAG